MNDRCPKEVVVVSSNSSVSNWNTLWVVFIIISNRLLCFQLGRRATGTLCWGVCVFEGFTNHALGLWLLRAVLMCVLVWNALGTKTILRGRENTNVEEKNCSRRYQVPHHNNILQQSVRFIEWWMFPLFHSPYCIWWYLRVARCWVVLGFLLLTFLCSFLPLPLF